MSNNNIYDIAISELIAREDGNGSGGGSGVTALSISMDAPFLLPLSTAVPNPITVTSQLSVVPSDWEIIPSSHTIYINLNGGFLPLISGSSQTQVGTDGNGGITGPTPNEVVREYYSEISLREIAVPSNIVVYTSNTIQILTQNSIYYGFAAVPPTGTGGLPDAVLVGNTILKVPSNNAFDQFYIAVPTAEAQPVAIADEHGLITKIDEYPELVGAITDFTTYNYKWPIKFTGNYLHTFTLIYS